eukprot:COSAG01_NODE_16984_length_1188_cov_1.622590_1_plen_198_part_10
MAGLARLRVAYWDSLQVVHADSAAAMSYGGGSRKRPRATVDLTGADDSPGAVASVGAAAAETETVTLLSSDDEELATEPPQRRHRSLAARSPRLRQPARRVAWGAGAATAATGGGVARRPTARSAYRRCADAQRRVAGAPAAASAHSSWRTSSWRGASSRRSSGARQEKLRPRGRLRQRLRRERTGVRVLSVSNSGGA